VENAPNAASDANKSLRLEVTALRAQMAAQSEDMRELKALLEKQLPRTPKG